MTINIQPVGGSAAPATAPQLAQIRADLGVATSGLMTIVPLTTHTLIAADLKGVLLEQQTAGALTLSVATTAASGIPWVPGTFVALGSVNAGAFVLAALAGVTIVNIGAKAVVQDDTPLILRMSPTLDRWLVL